MAKGNRTTGRGHASETFQSKIDYTLYSWILQNTGVSRDEWEREATDEEFEAMVNEGAQNDRRNVALHG